MRRAIVVGVVLVALAGCGDEDGGTTPLQEVPQAPAHVAMGTMYDDRVVLHWDGVTYAEYYTVYRRSGSSAAVALGTTREAFFVDGGLPALAMYEYQVSAVDDAGESQPSAWVTGRTLPTVPKPPAALLGEYQTATGYIRLTWSPSPDTVTCYKLYRALMADSTTVPTRERFYSIGDRESIPADSTGYNDIVEPQTRVVCYCIAAVRIEEDLTAEGECHPAWPDYVRVAVP